MSITKAEFVFNVDAISVIGREDNNASLAIGLRGFTSVQTITFSSSELRDGQYYLIKKSLMSEKYIVVKVE